jgi:PiT family inorganic phosphate transporter
MRRTLHDKNLYEPAHDRPPVWWMRGILVLTCTGVSFAHGTNDGQKSIGLIMLTIIGLFPATYALNPEAGKSLADLPNVMREAEPLIRQYGNDQRHDALAAIRTIDQAGPAATTRLASIGVGDSGRPVGLELGSSSPAARQRSNVRDDVYRVISQLKHVEEARAAPEAAKKQAKELGKQLGKSVEYAPLWVRVLSALCLGIGTMIGYRRIVTTLGERLGNIHLTPAQGAAAEVVSAALIGVAGFTGLPVSTTHIVTSGIGGTMVTAGAGLRYGMLSRILTAWLLTLPITILVAGTLYYVLASPKL